MNTEDVPLFSHPGNFLAPESIRHVDHQGALFGCKLNEDATFFSHPGKLFSDEHINATGSQDMTMEYAAQGVALCESSDLFSHPGKLHASERSKDSTSRDLEIECPAFSEGSPQSGSDSESENVLSKMTFCEQGALT